jgi:hypothetical protein
MRKAAPAGLFVIRAFAGEYPAWEFQVRYFARRYRRITYNARGYPPSDVPNLVDNIRSAERSLSGARSS